MQRVWSTYLDNHKPRRADSPHLTWQMDNNSPRSSRRTSITSSYSQATSTRHILADMPASTDFLNPNPSNNLSAGSNSNANLSLSVNYIPAKFSATLLSSAGFRNRKGRGADSNANLPKRGGGLEAFKSGESRMPQGKGQLRWNKFKWILFGTNLALTIFSLVSLVICLLTWFDVWEHADVIRVGNRPELIVSTIAACIGILTSVVGWAGIVLNNRGFLAWYTFLTWITFAVLVIPGYITYRKRTFNLEGKINAQWSKPLGSQGRLRIQNQLQCCGYFSPFVEATISQTCYARSILPGCKGPYLHYERKILGVWFKAVFTLAAAQIVVMVAGLMCSNHITYRFGKGMMPEAYRLNMNTMAVIMDNYATQLSEQYGPDVANRILENSQSNVNLPGQSAASHAPLSPFHAKYDSLSQR